MNNQNISEEQACIGCKDIDQCYRPTVVKEANTNISNAQILNMDCKSADTVRYINTKLAAMLNDLADDFNHDKVNAMFAAFATVGFRTSGKISPITLNSTLLECIKHEFGMVCIQAYIKFLNGNFKINLMRDHCRQLALHYSQYVADAKLDESILFVNAYLPLDPKITKKQLQALIKDTAFDMSLDELQILIAQHSNGKDFVG
jgi:hypothetical protein